MYDILELNKKLVSELREIAESFGITKAENLKKNDLIYQILDKQAILISQQELERQQKKEGEPKSQKRPRIAKKQNSQNTPLASSSAGKTESKPEQTQEAVDGNINIENSKPNRDPELAEHSSSNDRYQHYNRTHKSYQQHSIWHLQV